MLWVFVRRAGAGIPRKRDGRVSGWHVLLSMYQIVWSLFGGAVVGTGVSRGWVFCFPRCCCCFMLFGCVSGEAPARRTFDIHFFRVWIVWRVEEPVLVESGGGRRANYFPDMRSGYLLFQ